MSSRAAGSLNTSLLACAEGVAPPPSSAANALTTTLEKQRDVLAWLTAHNIECYAAALSTEGYDAVPFFARMTAEDIGTVAEKLQMPPPHTRAFHEAVTEIQSRPDEAAAGATHVVMASSIFDDPPAPTDLFPMSTGEVPRRPTYQELSQELDFYGATLDEMVCRWVGGVALMVSMGIWAASNFSEVVCGECTNECDGGRMWPKYCSGGGVLVWILSALTLFGLSFKVAYHCFYESWIKCAVDNVQQSGRPYPCSICCAVIMMLAGFFLFVYVLVVLGGDSGGDAGEGEDGDDSD